MRTSKGTGNVRVSASTASTNPYGTFTVSEEDYYRFWVADTSPEYVVNFQLELGSTASAYEPYQGTTIPISWQSSAGTVYGGTLDVTTGALRVTMASVDLGMLNWDKQNTTTSFRFVTNGGAIQSKSYAASVTPDAICSQYKQSTADKTWQAAEIGFSIGGDLHICLSRGRSGGLVFTSLSEFSTQSKALV